VKSRGLRECLKSITGAEISVVDRHIPCGARTCDCEGAQWRALGMVAWTLEGGWEGDRRKYTHLCLLWGEETSLGEEEESNKF
jgi:hypothetical protein